MTARSVLVVDDDPDIVEYLSALLEDAGFRVFAACDAVGALAAVKDSRPDAVLVDVMMPGRSGLDLLVTIRRDPTLTGLPLIVVTGNDHVLEDDCRSYLASHMGVRGPDGVLGKPVVPELLFELLDRVTLEREPC